MQLVFALSGYGSAGFSDFQRNYRLGSNLADRNVDLRTFAFKNFQHTDFFKTLTDGRK